MNEQLHRATESALKTNLHLKKGEKLLVVTDKDRLAIGQAFFKSGSEITNRSRFVVIPIPSINGAEPPESIIEDMLWADVIVAPLSKSISWTKARRKATDNGARLASMSGITEEILLRNFPLDYRSIKSRVNRICDVLDAGSAVQITTSLGTDLTFSIAGRKAYGREGGIYETAGEWGNLPCGESFIAPLESTATGRYIVDASQVGVGLIREPIELIVEHGQVVYIRGGKEATRFSEMLKGVNDEKAYTICEFGIGANHQASVNGIVLEDEKVLGTCHIALGNNVLFGGNTDVAIHVDGVLRAPSIWVDDLHIMDSGKLTI